MRRLLAVAIALALPSAAFADDPFFVTVVDAATGRGVPLVELETVHHLTFVTDNAGVAAIDAPELFGQRVYFGVRSHGYEAAADGFGYRGARLDVEPGGEATVTIKRINIAERLYRVTGGGLYADSLRKGLDPPIAQPLLNAGVMGQDSIQSTVYNGRLFLMWGDTNLPGYPLGVFHMTGATSALPADGGLDPKQGIDLTYFTNDDGVARAIAEMPGDGPTWLAGPFVLKDPDGAERMYAGYSKIKPPLDAYRHGVCRWNDETETFEDVVHFPKESPLLPIGHAAIRETPEGRHVYFGGPFPLIRAPATHAAITDAAQYEGYTCLVDGGRLERPTIDRADDGTIRWAWKKNTSAVSAIDAAKLLKDGVLKEHEAPFPLRDRETGKSVVMHHGTVNWNEFRKRWVMIGLEIYGTSLLGEVWYAEADTPLGPWVYATKIVTHDKYSFYNVKHHDYFDTDGGRTLYFEGTYTKEFSGNPVPTPRYDYNQIMYSLDLRDERTILPVAVRLKEGGSNGTARDEDSSFSDWKTIDFFACDRAGTGTIPVGRHEGRLVANAGEKPVFHAVAADAQAPPEGTAELYEFIHPTSGQVAYSTSDEPPAPGFVRQPNPVCRVWPNPYRSP